jgi:hypothetical protein
VSIIEAISPRGQLSGELHRPNNTNHDILLYKHITGEEENPVVLAPGQGVHIQKENGERKGGIEDQITNRHQHATE